MESLFWACLQLYSISLSSGSDVVRLFAKRSAKLRAPSENWLTRTQKEGVCAHASKLCLHADVTARS